MFKKLSNTLKGFTKKRTNFLYNFSYLVFCAVILFLSLRGNVGNPSSFQLNDPYWKDDGPMELSPERGRYALMYSLIEDRTFHFSLSLAQFASPDVAYVNGKFASLFAPALSFLIIPGYIVGKLVGLAQVGTFAMICVFALFNVALIRGIINRLNLHPVTGYIAGLLFLFATPAFAYAVSLYQHHVSTFLILSSIYVLLRWKNLWALSYIWFACAFSVVLDNPNLFFMVPLGTYGLIRLLPVSETSTSLQIKIKPLAFLTFFVMVLPMAFFMYVNYKSYGNPFQLAGTNDTGGREISKILGLPTEEFTQEQEKSEPTDDQSGYEEDESKTALGFFKPRQLPTGLYTHFISNDRSMRMYTPVILLGFIGIFLLGYVSLPFQRLIISIIGLNILLYSMWGDPWGGWAFGSRYLIPSYALLSIGIAALLSKYRHNLVVILLVMILGGYSVFVNTVGALTTSRIPPYIQVLALEAQTGMRERYTYTRSMEMLDHNKSKSLFFQTVAQRHITAWQFAISLMVIIGGLNTLLLLKLFLSDNPIILKPRTLFAKKTRKRRR